MAEQSRIERLGVPEEARASVTKWLELLAEWNARIDLTAARSDDELYDLMLADALVLAKHLPTNARVVDVGTGAGAPGLALAPVRPDLKVTLVEPLAKRIAFLRTVLGSVGRMDVVLTKERGEAVARRSPGGWDVATSRATLGPASWVPMGLTLAPETWVLLAREEPPSIAGGRSHRRLSLHLADHGSRATRRAVRAFRVPGSMRCSPQCSTAPRRARASLVSGSSLVTSVMNAERIGSSSTRS